LISLEDFVKVEAWFDTFEGSYDAVKSPKTASRSESTISGAQDADADESDQLDEERIS